MKPDQAEKDKSSAVAVFPQDARDDVGGAQNAGMLGILVRTGKTKKSLPPVLIPAPGLVILPVFPLAVST